MPIKELKDGTVILPLPTYITDPTKRRWMAAVMILSQPFNHTNS